jgi:hypothetical protein
MARPKYDDIVDLLCQTDGLAIPHGTDDAKGSIRRTAMSWGD